jgi:hypothetical protein
LLTQDEYGGMSLTVNQVVGDVTNAIWSLSSSQLQTDSWNTGRVMIATADEYKVHI